MIFVSKMLWRVRYEGVENIPREGGLILAPNHASHLDPPIIGIGVPRNVAFIAKRELFETPFIGWWMREMGQIRVDRGGGGRHALKAAQTALENGSVIIIFPEGTRSPTGRMQAGRNGVSVLALKTGVAVIPVGIEGTFEIYPKGRLIPRSGRVIVRYGKPFNLGRVAQTEDPVSKAKLEEATALIMQEIQRLVPEKIHPLPGEVPDCQLLSVEKGTCLGSG